VQGHSPGREISLLGLIKGTIYKCTPEGKSASPWRVRSDIFYWAVKGAVFNLGSILYSEYDDH